MAEELKRQIQDITKFVPGVHGVVVADKDGVPVLRINDESVPDTLLRPNFFSNVSFATDQASKLGYGKTNHIISLHERHQLVHFNIHPLILTIIADADTNTGLLLTLSSELREITDAVRIALQL